MPRQTRQAAPVQNAGRKNSYTNLLIGILVVIGFAAIIIGLIRGKSTTPQPDVTTNQATQSTQPQESLPTKHTVTQGETLWTISEHYYNTGYNWPDIAKANNLSNPSNISAGMELTIPVVTPIMPMVTQPEVSPTEAAMQPAQPTTTPTPMKVMGAITGNSYTVVRGDNLWSIAVRAYGDGFRWEDIAKANKLANPRLIHAGNVFTLPR
jgi:nucleoid-associated protein YgaU